MFVKFCFKHTRGKEEARLPTPSLVLSTSFTAADSRLRYAKIKKIFMLHDVLYFRYKFLIIDNTQTMKKKILNQLFFQPLVDG